MKIEYEVISPSKLIVKSGDKKLTISGEATANRVFYADTISIKNWSSSAGEIIITKEVRDEIISYISEDSKNSSIPILFE